VIAKVSRELVILCIALAVLWPLGVARAQGDIESLLPGIVKIVASGATKKTGTGFVVARSQGETYIVTAAHVVEGAERVSVFFYDRPSRAVPGTASRIQASDPRGLGLVTVSEAVSASVTPLALASDVRMSRGDPVKGVGHQASHGDWGVISGDVASREGSLIRIQAPVEQQTSGGPVIRDGRVVGMFVSQQPNVGIAITALAVQDYLDGALPPGAQASATAKIFSDDFSDGNADGWYYIRGGWSVGQDSGNYYLQGKGHSHARPYEGENWTAYMLEARVKLLKGGIHLEYLLSKNGGSRYYIGFREDEIYIDKQLPPDKFMTLAQARKGLTLDRWHLIQIKGKGGKIEVYVDSTKQLEYLDSSPLENGGIGFETLDDSEAYVDDVIVVPFVPHLNRPTSRSHREWGQTALALPEAKQGSGSTG